ncbi:MAG: segregation/condensation protein A [Erysipelotrichaceae bacterium]|nr:segregation/condensation protein A [Erysipelotrichaceae bacterium]
MSFTAELQIFDGPLDLMLHLIREQKLDIFDLDMEVLCDQYLAYLEKLEDLQLEVESEYLVELATLVEYKSRKLLPKNDASIDDDYEEDPKERLVRRLLEYQRYKDASQLLQQSLEARNDQLSKPLELDAIGDDENGEYIDASANDLFKAMSRVLRKLELNRPLPVRIAEKEISTEERKLVIRSRLIDLPDIFTFDNLLDDCRSVYDVIVTFLAVLDLARQHVLSFKVGKNDTIYMRRGILNG